MSSLYDLIDANDGWTDEGYGIFFPKRYTILDYSEIYTDDDILSVMKKYHQCKIVDENYILRSIVLTYKRNTLNDKLILYALQSGADIKTQNYGGQNLILFAFICKLPHHILLEFFKRGANPNPCPHLLSPLLIVLRIYDNPQEMMTIIRMLFDYKAIISNLELDEIILKLDNSKALTDVLFFVLRHYFNEKYKKPRATRLMQSYVKRKQLHPDYVWTTDAKHRTTVEILYGTNRDDNDKIYKALTKR